MVEILMGSLKTSKLIDKVNSFYRSGYVFVGSTKAKHRKTLRIPFENYSDNPRQNLKPPIVIRKLVNALDNIGKWSIKTVFKASENYFQQFINSPQAKMLSGQSQQKQYIQNFVNLSKTLINNQDIKIMNTKNLDKIVQKNEPCIFIMNHGNYVQDCFSLAKLNETLYQKSLDMGTAENCPKPKIVVNKYIMESQPSNVKTFFDNIGAVSINAEFYYPEDQSKRHNVKQFLPLLKDFVQGKNHIFIFPEGGLGTYMNVYPLEQRFQIGVGNMAKIIADNNSKGVHVVPVGFDYKSAESDVRSNIVVGKPVHIRKKNNQYYTTAGNIKSENASEAYRQFFYGDKKDSKYRVIKNGDEQIPEYFMERYISGILAENLKIVMDEAKKSV